MMLEESKKTIKQHSQLALDRTQAPVVNANRIAQIEQARKAAQVARDNERNRRENASLSIKRTAAQRQKPADVDVRWADEQKSDSGQPIVYGGGISAIQQKIAALNVGGKREYKLEEEAPAMSIGGGMQGLDSAKGEPIAGMDPVMTPAPLRRRPPKIFAGKRVFTVPSKEFYKATLGRKKGAHWRSMVNGPLGEEIRQYALENKNAPIIVEDEITGAMMYLRYGK